MMISSKSYCFSAIVTLLYFFFLLSLVLHTLASPILHYCRHDQRDALLEFKHEFTVNESNSSSYFLSLWNKNSDCCLWMGVTCDAKSGEVISLDLDSISLNNSLKPNSGLFKLHHLRTLSLEHCELYGEVPSSLGNLFHLTHLSLLGNYLVGEVPASFGNLTQLKYLDLCSNQFSGNLPLSFANLTKLSHLDISSNQFTGENFPLVLLNLSTSLSFLEISHNLFKSTLPPDMSRFHSLEIFFAVESSLFGPFPTSLLTIPSLTLVYLAENQFKGPIEFRNKSSSSSQLQELYLSQNKLDGHIPKSIPKFPKLHFLDLSHNNFSGPIPGSISKLVNLDALYLNHNNFSGPIPRSISKLVNLDQLYLNHNNFTGPIPRSISKLVNLTILYLSHNSFSGPMPSSISKLVHLHYVDLSNNKLEGEIPGWFGGVLQWKLSHNSFSSIGNPFEIPGSIIIQELDLSSNLLQGPLPHWICKLTPIFLLDLSNNGFNGSIPQCLRNLGVRLSSLNLQNNNLSGTLLPDMIVNWINLVSLDVSGNHLEGTLPESLINCTNLQLLNVQGNMLKDKFPSWLGSLPALEVLIIRSNGFYGPLYHPHASIGFQTLKVIDISHNDFSGTLPPFYFSNWREMTNVTKEVGDMYMGYNSHTYSEQMEMITMEMVNKGVDTKYERIRRDFRAIDFSENNFRGEIPKSIGLLKGLHLLNLSGNAFTNNIPQSLANLTNLEALDVSRNQLSGQIPPDLGSLSFLSIMNFSHNNLQGPIPRGTQFQRQNCSTFIDNPKLYGLEDVCAETHVPNPTPPPESEDLSEPEEQQVISWIAAGIAYGPGVFCGLVIGYIFSPLKLKWFM